MAQRITPKEKGSICKHSVIRNNFIFKPGARSLGPRKVVGRFDGGTITSDAGALLLREVDRATNFFGEFSSCFTDYRDQRFVEYSMRELVAQRIVGVCLGYEDLNDHDELRRNPVLAGKSTLNRLESFGVGDRENQKNKKICYSEEQIYEFFIDVFLKSYSRVPKEIILDLDATDDPLHGSQQGRFFHGYYDCYCYLPMYVFCGDRLLYAKLKTANLDPGNESLPDVGWLVERIRARWPEVRIILRGDSGFCRAHSLPGLSARPSG